MAQLLLKTVIKGKGKRCFKLIILDEEAVF
jgi:hypothetical protein